MANRKDDIIFTRRVSVIQAVMNRRRREKGTFGKAGECHPVSARKRREIETRLRKTNSID